MLPMLPIDKEIDYLDLGFELKNLSQIETETIIDNIAQYKKLEILMLDYNSLAHIGNTIFSLENLQKIFLSHNKLKYLPENIGMLNNLKELYIQNNLLESLPESFSNLINLKTLNLSNNRIRHLPKNLNNLVNLQNISIEYNCLTCVPSDITNNNFWKFDLSSYSLENLSDECETLIIYNLNDNLDNLSPLLKELKLFTPIEIKKIKLPHDCKLYINDILCENYI